VNTNALLRRALAARARQPFLPVVVEEPLPALPAPHPTPEVPDLNQLLRAAVYGPSPIPADAEEATP
jgi:hypothetical protein